MPRRINRPGDGHPRDGDVPVRAVRPARRRHGDVGAGRLGRVRPGGATEPGVAGAAGRGDVRGPVRAASAGPRWRCSTATGTIVAREVVPTRPTTPGWRGCGPRPRTGTACCVGGEPWGRPGRFDWTPGDLGGDLAAARPAAADPRRRPGAGPGDVPRGRRLRRRHRLRRRRGAAARRGPHDAAAGRRRRRPVRRRAGRLDLPRTGRADTTTAAPTTRTGGSRTSSRTGTCSTTWRSTRPPATTTAPTPRRRRPGSSWRTTSTCAPGSLPGRRPGGRRSSPGCSTGCGSGALAGARVRRHDLGRRARRCTGSTSRDQRAWLEEAFASSSADAVWQVPFSHHPAWCAGPHHVDMAAADRPPGPALPPRPASGCCCTATSTTSSTGGSTTSHYVVSGAGGKLDGATPAPCSARRARCRGRPRRTACSCRSRRRRLTSCRTAPTPPGGEPAPLVRRRPDGSTVDEPIVVRRE